MFDWPTTSLPKPVGPYQVGCTDILTPGLPETSSLVRILYPARSTNSFTMSPLWTDSTPKDACINLLQCMLFNWPSWAPNSEYLLLPTCYNFMNETTFPLIFRHGWSLLGERLTIPIIPDAPIHAPPSSKGWPIVLFSHGVGCTRATMSQITYQLASQGVMVIAVEHRDGSASSSFYRETRESDLVVIPHRKVKPDEFELGIREKQAKQRAYEMRRAIELLSDIQGGIPVDNCMTPLTPTVASPLAGTLDLSSLYLMGHSFGGATAIMSASNLRQYDISINGLIALDPWMFPVHKVDLCVDSRTKVFIINSEHFKLKENVDCTQRAVEDCKEVKWMVQKGGVHLSATDIPMIFPQVHLRRGLGFMAEATPEDCMEETNQIIWEFLSKNLEDRKVH